MADATERGATRVSPTLIRIPGRGIDFLPLAAPFEGKQLPGYYFPPGQLGSQPSGMTLMAMSGFVGTCEETWFQCGFTAQEGADAHCQLGNLPLSNALLLDWLEEKLA